MHRAFLSSIKFADLFYLGQGSLLQRFLSPCLPGRSGLPFGPRVQPGRGERYFWAQSACPARLRALSLRVHAWSRGIRRYELGRRRLPRHPRGKRLGCGSIVFHTSFVAMTSAIWSPSF